MSDDDPAPRPKPTPKPPITRDSPEWRAMEGPKQRAYAAQRQRHTDAVHRRLTGLQDEPEPAEEETAAPEPARATEPAQQQHDKHRPSRARGRIHHLAQGDLDFGG